MTTYYYHSIQEFLSQPLDWVEAETAYQATDRIELTDKGYRLRWRFNACQETIQKVKSALRRRIPAGKPRLGPATPDPVRQGIAYGRWVRESGNRDIYLYPDPGPGSRALKAAVATLAAVLDDPTEPDASVPRLPGGRPSEHPGITHQGANYTPWGTRLTDHYEALLNRVRQRGYVVHFIDPDQTVVADPIDTRSDKEEKQA